MEKSNTFNFKKLLVTAAVMLGSSVASANLVNNGSFEAELQEFGTWHVYTSLTGWDTTAGPGIELRNNVVGEASSGVNFIELDSHGNGGNANSSMAQHLNTKAGTWYELLFDYSARIDQPESTNGISAYWNGGLVANVAASGVGKTTNDWVAYAYKVLGTGNDDLSFGATGTSDTLGGNIDNVRVNEVPTPSALWLFGTVIGIFALNANRKRI